MERASGRRLFFGFALAILVLAGAGCADSEDSFCPGSLSYQAVGYISTDLNLFKPRELVVRFSESAPAAEVQAALDSAQAEVLFQYPSTYLYTIRTALGYNLEEIMAVLRQSPWLIAVVPNYVGSIPEARWGVYRLLGQESGDVLLWFNDEPGVPPLEQIVLVEGWVERIAPDGHPFLKVSNILALTDRIIRLVGTVALVDRGLEGVVVILEEADGAAWELLGPLAEEIRSLAEASPGLALTVRGVEIFPNLTSRAGGLSLRVTAYQPGG